MTPLHYSSEKGHLSVTKILIEHGALMSEKNKDG